MTSCECTPEHFGAAGDGTSDDTEALQAYSDHMIALRLGPHRASLPGGPPEDAHHCPPQPKRRKRGKR